MSDLAQRYANFNSTRIQAIVDHLRTLNLALLSRKNDLNKVFSRAGVQVSYLNNLLL